MHAKNMSVGSKLLVILILPMLGFFWFGAMRVIDSMTLASDAKHIVKDAGLVGVMGSLIHALQLERGATSFYVSSHGTKMGDRLPGLRENSDKAILAYKTKMEAWWAEGNAGGNNVLSSLEILGELRRNADSLKINAGEVRAHYTLPIQTLLGMARGLGRGSSDVESMQDTDNYITYINMKERAGRERAMLAAMLGAGKTEAAYLMEASENLGEFKMALAQFSLNSRPELLAFHKEKVVGQAVDEVERIRTAVLNTPVNQEFGIDSLHWFDVATERINLMKVVEEKLAGDLLARTEAKQKAATASFVTTAALAGVLVLTVILIAWLSAKSITAPLKQMRSVIGDVEKNGDFTQRIPVDSNDEVGQTAKSFNDLMVTLQAALHNLLGNVDKVSDAANSLSITAGLIAAGSAQQSEATYMMAAKIEQVTFSIDQVHNSAHNALKISQKSGELSVQGDTIIHNASNEMMQISETVRQTSIIIEQLGQQSNQITSVVQVIKEVADQTNLLALNAAIEAARAGEQGRGFAVVADEVRKLAERTSRATEEIAKMIGSIQNSARTAVDSMSAAVSQVGGGVALAQQAGEAISQIKDCATQVIDMMNDISAAMQEQGGTSNDFTTQVENVAQMSEKNSIATGETADAAGNLKQLAQDMRAAVSKFKI